VVELKDFCLRVSLVIVKKFPVIGFVDGSQSASVHLKNHYVPGTPVPCLCMVLNQLVFACCHWLLITISS
jgi:hypothetical protein